MQVIKPFLGIKAPLLGLRNPLSSPKLLHREQLAFPTLSNKLSKSLAITQGLGASQFLPLFSDFDVLPMSVDGSLTEWDAELPTDIPIKPLESKNAQQNDVSSEQANQFSVQSTNPKQSKSKAKKKQAKAKSRSKPKKVAEVSTAAAVYQSLEQATSSSSSFIETAAQLEASGVTSSPTSAASSSSPIQLAANFPPLAAQSQNLSNLANSPIQSSSASESVVSALEALPANITENTTHLQAAEGINFTSFNSEEAATNPVAQPVANFPPPLAQPTRLESPANSPPQSLVASEPILSALEPLPVNTSENKSHFLTSENIEDLANSPGTKAVTSSPAQAAVNFPPPSTQPHELTFPGDNLPRNPNALEPGLSTSEALQLNTAATSSPVPPAARLPAPSAQPHKLSSLANSPIQSSSTPESLVSATVAATNPPAVRPAANLPQSSAQPTRLRSLADNLPPNPTVSEPILSALEALPSAAIEDIDTLTNSSLTEAATTSPVQPTGDLPALAAQPHELSSTDLPPNPTAAESVLSALEALPPSAIEDTNQFQTKNINANSNSEEATASPSIQPATSLPSSPAQLPELSNPTDSLPANPTVETSALSALEALPAHATAANPSVQPAANLPASLAQPSRLSSSADIEQPAIADFLPGLEVSDEVNAIAEENIIGEADDSSKTEEHEPPLPAKTAFDSLPPPQGFAIGGHVTVTNNFVSQPIAPSDTVPAMLTPGEFVINAKDAQENLNLLKHINSGGKVPEELPSPPTEHDKLDTELDKISTIVESTKGSSVQRKSADVGLPRALSSLIPSFLGLETEKWNFSTLSSPQPNENQTADSSKNSTSSYASTPLIFRKRSSQAYTPEAHIPNQWSSIQDLLNDNTEGSNEFTSLSSSNKELHYRNSQVSIKPEMTRSSGNSLPQPKGFATGGEVTASNIYTAATPVTETIKPPNSPTTDNSVSDDLEMLAREMYHRLRQRLELERERYGIYSGRLPW